jgi:hypothetical protein
MGRRAGGCHREGGKDGGGCQKSCEVTASPVLGGGQIAMVAVREGGGAPVLTGV